MKKETREWTVKFPWGNVAMLSWGDPVKPPILLVHGYMDSAATFIPLVEAMPDDYYYVGLDMPGNGKSDPFPPGLIVSHLHIVEVVRGVVEHMTWGSFIYVSHSMGATIGFFYNHIYPGKIKKMVHLDPAVPLSVYYYPQYTPDYWYQYIYDNFYNKYFQLSADDEKEMTRKEIINLFVQTRGLTEDKAETTLSRLIVPTGDGKFRLSWDARMKKIAPVPIPEETLLTVLTEHTPPTLFIEASENKTGKQEFKFAKNIIRKCLLTQPNFSSVTVQGGHNVHITDPEEIIPHIVDFLKGAGIYKKSKL